MALKDRLQRAREARSLTQEDLAALVGCGQSIIGNLESTQSSSKWIPKIAWVLDVPALWLVDDDFAGPDPLEQVDDAGAKVVELAAHRNQVVAAVVQLMEATDDRGRLECFAAVKMALDRHEATRSQRASGE